MVIVIIMNSEGFGTVPQDEVDRSLGQHPIILLPSN
jgi:hypothetical protein